MESPYRDEYQETIEKCIKFIKSKAIGLSTHYEIAITTYAFSLIDKNTEYEPYLNELKKIQKQISENEVTWGQGEDPSVQVETVGYVILALLRFEKSNEVKNLPLATNAMKWLISQRNQNDGFHSTTDTVVGIQALAEISEKLKPSLGSNVTLTIKMDNEKKTVMINEDNKVEVEKFSISQERKNVNLEYSGVGVVYGSLTISFFSTIVTSNKKGFDISVVSEMNEAKTIATLKINVSLIASSSRMKSSMAIVEINLPSGFVSTSESDILKKNSYVGVRVNFETLFKNNEILILKLKFHRKLNL